MSKHAVEAFFGKNFDKRCLSSKAYKVLNYLCWKDNDGLCFPGHKSIRDAVSMTNRSIKLAIKELVELRLIEVFQDHPTDHGLGCRYVLRIGDWGTTCTSDTAGITGTHSIRGTNGCVTGVPTGVHAVPPINIDNKIKGVCNTHAHAPAREEYPTLDDCLAVANVTRSEGGGITDDFARKFHMEMTNVGWMTDTGKVTRENLRRIMGGRWNWRRQRREDSSSSSSSSSSSRPSSVSMRVSDQPVGVVLRQEGYDATRFDR